MLCIHFVLVPQCSSQPFLVFNMYMWYSPRHSNAPPLTPGPQFMVSQGILLSRAHVPTIYIYISISISIFIFISNNIHFQPFSSPHPSSLPTHPALQLQIPQTTTTTYNPYPYRYTNTYAHTVSMPMPIRIINVI